ncbi:tetratricopeptide repeat protein [Nonomuraea helvata]|uniref:Tetratricopeptide repeat protein n=1 Tax=Nonomuraea helvata TaxID=37484 RepID=A0ABV5SA28_9ACTN
MTEDPGDTGGLGIAHDTLADSYRRRPAAPGGRGVPASDPTPARGRIHHGHPPCSHWWLGHTLHDLGRHEEARESWRESLDLLREASLLAPIEGTDYLAQPVPDTPESIRNQL